MTYTVHTVSSLDWSLAEKAPISHYQWPEFSTYRPEAYAQLLVLEGKGLAVRLCCKEENPKADYHNFFDPVYTDSCLEFFFTTDKSGRYFNNEINANGTALMAIGADRHARTPIDRLITPPAVKAEQADGWWSVEFFHSLENLRTVFGSFSLEKGSRFYGNFYKCGDETAVPHYGMWSPVTTAEPDFHRPEYFGTMIID